MDMMDGSVSLFLDTICCLFIELATGSSDAEAKFLDHIFLHVNRISEVISNNVCSVSSAMH